MSIDYYMVCPKCKRYAQVYRFTAGGFNPPNGLKVHDFFLTHNHHEGFLPAVHEQDAVMDDVDEENGWLMCNVWGEGREAEEILGRE